MSEGDPRFNRGAQDVRAAELSLRQSHQPASGLGQIGEFSCVLASALVAADSISPEFYAALLAAVAISIAGSSVAVRLVRQLAAPDPNPLYASD
jgi:Kef-type K+ transport system membrane component KefB